MQINLSPQLRIGTLTVAKAGETLTINGTAYDLSTIVEGTPRASADIGCPCIVGDVERIAGDLIVTLILPIGADASQAALFPAPIVNPADGQLALPA